MIYRRVCDPYAYMTHCFQEKCVRGEWGAKLCKTNVFNYFNYSKVVKATDFRDSVTYLNSAKHILQGSHSVQTKLLLLLLAGFHF